VHDNPILADFRTQYESVGKLNWEDRAALTRAWHKALAGFTALDLPGRRITAEHVDHARRVLTKLAALS
jgi:hypothetical protein